VLFGGDESKQEEKESDEDEVRLLAISITLNLLNVLAYALNCSIHKP
jgi:hypothetical protein